MERGGWHDAVGEQYPTVFGVGKTGLPLLCTNHLLTTMAQLQAIQSS